MYIQYDTKGNRGIIKADSGNQLVVMPKKTISLIEEAVIMNEDLVDEREVQDVLHISKKTLCNYCASGKIPHDDYTTAVTGRKFFWLRKLLGMKDKGARQLEIPLHNIL